MSFRIEEKVVCTRSELFQICAELAGRGMEPLHPNRIIRSLYYDTEGLDMFADSEEGSLPRRKIRVRDYPQVNSTPTLETKISSIEGRFKITRPLVPDEAEGLQRDGILDSHYGLCWPAVWVSYDRGYYLLDGIRVTFDTQIVYRGFDSSRTHFEENCVIELKAPHATSRDFLETLLPVPRRRFSKYSNAIGLCVERCRTW